MAEAGAAASGGWTPARSVAGGRNPWAILSVISIATFMTTLDSSIANVALDHIAGSTGSSYDEATWVLTTFLVAQAAITPISGWLADVVGRKRYYMFSVFLFTFASFLCGISQDLTVLIMARILQGIGGGGLAPVEQSMLVDTFPPAKRSLAFAAYGVVVVAGPTIGPTLGGWLTDNFDWHWVFLINIPVGVLSLILVHLFVDEPKALVEQRKKLTKAGLKFDFGGFGLAALFLGALEITLDRGQRLDWFSSPVIQITSVVCVLSLCAFIPWELTRKDPVVKIRLFFQRNFAVASLLLMVVGLLIFGTTQFIPQLLQQVLGYTATDAGLALTAGGAAIMIMMPVAGILGNKVDPRLLIAFSLIVQSFALWNMSHLDTQISFAAAAKARMIQAVGLPFMFVPITAVAYVGLKPEESNQASALMNVMRNLGGSIGISMVQTLTAQRQQFHQARYVETLNPLNPSYVNGLNQISQTLQANGQPSAFAPQQALSQIYGKLTQQAAMLSYIDAFHVLMLITLGCLPLLLLMQGPGKTKPPAGAGH
ncbi:DHA2 family efflux MFS transporter permease subunit [Caulobacter sp. S45]|uniref:DHA2 family efflux MFS transporter permease subunit n=1 Tax=Caulobacter sp. S45 TaxID=1641861 RepID=UPI00131B3D63|nr:DHA2 family efflux MFS transporter permease subunit [Caulobacter sp. S45]